MLHSLLVHSYYLIHNFIKIKIALTSHIAGGAKLTRKRTTHLRRNTNGHPLFSRYQHAFYEMSIVQLQAVLDGTIAAELAVIDLYLGYIIDGRKLFP